MSDARLVEMARAGEPAAFDVLVRRFQRAVHAAAFAVLSDQEAVLDVLQESFIAAYRQLHALVNPSKFGPWVCGIARNQAKQFRRDRGRLQSRELPLPETGLAADVAQPAHGIERIREALSVLTEVQADTVTLFYMEGYSIAECATLLGVPTGTVKRRLHDARRRLKKEMTDMVTQHLADYALPEDFRVVIDKPSRLLSNGASLAWFAGRWVLVWQDGVMWGKERWQCDRFECWLSESPDARTWSQPRLLEFGATQYTDSANLHLHQICVHRDRLYVHTYMHHNGIDLYSSEDLMTWTAHPRVRLGNAGRAGIFSRNGDLLIASPSWVSVEDFHGDRVDVLQSSDGGNAWGWLKSPSWPKAGITDAAGMAARDRIYVAWREFEGPQGARIGRLCLSSSHDGGKSWSDPKTVQPLTSGKRASFSLELTSTGDTLVIVQEVCDVGDNAGEVWLAFSQDGGETWPGKAVYAAGSLLDPAIAFGPDGSLVMAGSSRTGDESRPWVVHSRINRR